MVITANYIAQRFALDVKEQLERSGCKVLGTVLNRIPLKAGSYYNRYYKRYYGKYKKYSYKYAKYSKYGSYGSTGYETNTPAPSFSDEENAEIDVAEEVAVNESVDISVENIPAAEAPKHSAKSPMPSKESKYPKSKTNKNKKKKKK